jgi:hypothetical protein
MDPADEQLDRVARSIRDALAAETTLAEDIRVARTSFLEGVCEPQQPPCPPERPSVAAQLARLGWRGGRGDGCRFFLGLEAAANLISQQRPSYLDHAGRFD